MKFLQFTLAAFSLVLIALAPLSISHAQTGDMLAGSSWQLVSLDAETPIAEGSEITMIFGADGRVTGHAGCNTYGGSYTVDGETLTVSPLVLTRMMCPDEAVMAQESAFLAALEGAVRYEIAGGQLVIAYGEGQQLTFAPVSELAGAVWQLQTLNGNAVIEGSSLTLQFEATGAVGGSAGCNSFGGSYTLEGDRITFSALVSTMMACVNMGVMDQEVAYLQALQAATRYEVANDQLTLEGSEGQQLVFVRMSGLDGTAWQLTSLGGASVIEGSEVTLEFDSEGRVTGSGGCNSYSGSYTVEGDTITFGEVVTTEMACLEEGVMAQESAYYGALASATRFELAGDQLIIVYGDGEQLVFMRGSSPHGLVDNLLIFGLGAAD